MYLGSSSWGWALCELVAFQQPFDFCWRYFFGVFQREVLPLALEGAQGLILNHSQEGGETCWPCMSLACALGLLLVCGQACWCCLSPPGDRLALPGSAVNHRLITHQREVFLVKGHS